MNLSFYTNKKVFFLLFSFVVTNYCAAQKNVLDSVKDEKKITRVIDTIKPKIHNPRIALKRSAMIPGWGQIYNKQAWKIPIIYGALGVTGYYFVYNVNTYNDIRFAYNARQNKDTPSILRIKTYLKNLDVGSLNINRRKFRQNIDYTVLFFIAFWGLNCADAVVFAHLKNFDVSDNLSASLKIGSSSIAQTNGINLSFDIHKKKQKKLVYIK
jgi:Family of unknown function (DUF5683)